MFHSVCPRCSRKFISVGTARCFHCIGEAKTGVMGQQQTDFVTSRDTDEIRASGNLQFPSDNPASSDFQHSSLDQQRVKQNASEHPLVSKQNASEGSLFTQKQPTDNLETSARFCSAELNREFLYSGSSRKICSLNNHQPIQFSDPGASKAESVGPVEGISVLPGPSGLQRDIDTSKVIGDKSRHMNPSEIRFIIPEDQNKFTCWVCSEDVSEHTRDGEQAFKCCFCTFQTAEQAKLQMHSYEHQVEQNCDSCGKQYVGDSHNEELKCMECEEIFRCRTWLKEHYLGHEDFFSTHCCACIDLIIDHSYKVNGETRYVCCVCEYENDSNSQLKKHYKRHQLKIFCGICKEEYDTREKSPHVDKNTCFGCEERFGCKTQLENHLVEHEDCWSRHCFLCKKKIFEHEKPEPNERKPYKCCKSACPIKWRVGSELASHLLTHTNLRVLKCKDCLKRISGKNNLNRHLQSCSKKPYKCKICGLGFPNSDFVNVHRLKNHN